MTNKQIKEIQEVIECKIENILNDIIDEIRCQEYDKYDDCDFDFKCGMETAIEIIKEKMKK